MARITTCATISEKGTTSELLGERRIKRHVWKDRAIVMQCDPETAIVRLSGRRQAYPIKYTSIYNLAVKIAVEKARAEKLAASGRSSIRPKRRF